VVTTSERQPSPVPAGTQIRIPGRGATFIRDVAGPPGAPTVILLHGLAATTSINWPGAFAALSSHFRVVALDHRGHGRGIRTPWPFRLEDCADDVVALADALGIERIILVGYSMGGPIALLARRRHAGRVSGLVLCATSSVFNDERVNGSPLGAAVATSLRVTPPVIRRKVATAIVRAIGRESGFPPNLIDEMCLHDPAAVFEATRAVLRFDARTWVSELRCPAAVVVTELDRLVPARRQLELATATGATVHPITAGHDAAARDPGPFLEALSQACRSVSRRATFGHARA
jgi:pimeloyl-ACP methyl ester carboxylesterase